MRKPKPPTIRDQLRKLGLTQEQMAHASGLSLATVHRAVKLNELPARKTPQWVRALTRAKAKLAKAGAA